MNKVEAPVQGYLQRNPLRMRESELLPRATYSPTLAAETGQSKNPGGLKFGSTSVSLHFQVPSTQE